MNQFLEQIAERPTSHKVGIWIGILLFMTFIFWQYMYKSKSEQAAELLEKSESLEQELINKRRVARNLKKFEKEVEELNVKLKFALQELPDEQEIPDLLSSISNLARDAGLEVSLFKPAGERKRDFYAEVPVSVVVTGSFHQVATFFDEVGHLPRIVNINNISILNPTISDEKVMITSDCQAVTFRYLDEAERVESEEEQQKGRRRGRN
ncbi:MAG: type 4a pilus biogenesis protein PilO [Bdellovibrionales bacterium]|nr:type 4a pilus biogenesis protein PilO [Bdellovibrionales bacterium]